jgi:hypothetical protein
VVGGGTVFGKSGRGKRVRVTGLKTGLPHPALPPMGLNHEWPQSVADEQGLVGRKVVAVHTAKPSFTAGRIDQPAVTRIGGDLSFCANFEDGQRRIAGLVAKEPFPDE